MNKPNLISAWRQALQNDPGGIDSGWLAAGWRDPHKFWSALLAIHADIGDVAHKSALGERYDLYHDGIIRHLGHDRAALRWYERGRGWQVYSYEALHARCTALARVLVASGVNAGAIVAVVLPFGIDYVIAVLTGLRLGACISPLPPTARAYVGRRLGNLEPAHIITTGLYRDMLGDFADLIVEMKDHAAAGGAGDSPGTGDVRSTTYAAGDPCALLFSPLRDPSDQATPLSCDDAYLRALRDGLVILGLRPGEHLAAPGFATLQAQPCLLLAALLSGATYVHIPMSALDDAPELLMDWPLRSLGITTQVRDLLRTARLATTPSWRHWFRDPEQAGQWTAWQEFIDEYKLAQVPASNIIIEAAAGGALLASREPSGAQRMHTLTNVHPAAGVVWSLLDSNGSGQDTAGDIGIYAYGMDDPLMSHVLISRFRDHEYIYMGTTEPRRNGWVYPGDEVVDALEGLRYVDAGSVVAVPSGAPFQWRFVLLVFTGYQDTATPAAEAGRRREIERAITTLVGQEFMPDRIELVPLLARRSEGVVDHDWCRQQYLSGSLYRKAKTPVFAHLTALRQALGHSDTK